MTASKLFKLFLVALMGVCGIADIGYAQTAIVVDTAASQTAGCTLNPTTGVWNTRGGSKFGLRLKLVEGSNSVSYAVDFAVKDADGETVEFPNTSTKAFFNDNGVAKLATGTLARLDEGVYTVVFTLQSRQEDESWAAVSGVDDLTVTVEIMMPSFTFAVVPAAIDTVVDDNGFERWVFPSRTAPKFTVAMKGAELEAAWVLAYEGIPTGIAPQSIFREMLYEEPFEFVFKPQAEEDDDENAEPLAEYFPDGDYMIAVTDGEIDAYLYIRIGAPVLCNLEAVDAEEQVDPGMGNYQVFPYNEAVFAIKVENASEGWFAVVEVLTEVNKALVERDTLREQDTRATFTSLTSGEYYYAQCRVYDADGELLWSNFNNGSAGLRFQITDEERFIIDPTLTVTAADNCTLGDKNVFIFDGMASFTIEVTDLAEGDAPSNYTIKIGVYVSGEKVPLAEYEYDVIAPATVVEFPAIYNGEYDVDFVLSRKAGGNLPAEPGDLKETFMRFFIRVTNYEEQELAIENGELAGVNIYPNPSEGTFNVVVPEKARIDIFGMNGAQVMSREVNAGVEAFSLNHSGIYFVRVMAGNKTAVKRVVVR